MIEIKDDIVISLVDVWKIYDMGKVKVNALKGVNLDIKSGDFVAIIGSSGSGKSTMMNMIGCLDIPSKGEISLKGKKINNMRESDISQLRGRTIGFIFQQYNLVSSMSAFENVLLPMEFQNINDNLSQKRAVEVLKKVGLLDKVNHKPNELSGGQQQRVSIARCLVTNPEIILADEPTGALDSKTGNDILNLLDDLWKKENKTIIMVTHDLKLSKYANTIIELKDGEIINYKTDMRNKNEI